MYGIKSDISHYESSLKKVPFDTHGRYVKMIQDHISACEADIESDATPPQFKAQFEKSLEEMKKSDDTITQAAGVQHYLETKIAMFLYCDEIDIRDFVARANNFNKSLKEATLNVKSLSDLEMGLHKEIRIFQHWVSLCISCEILNINNSNYKQRLFSFIFRHWGRVSHSGK